MSIFTVMFFFLGSILGSGYSNVLHNYYFPGFIFFLGQTFISFFAPSVQIPFAPHLPISFSTGEGWGEDGAEEESEKNISFRDKNVALLN